MPKSEKQKLKLLYLYKMFHEETDFEHGLTMAEIIKKLEANDIKAERKSVYTDIQALQDFGLSLDKRTKGGRTEYFLEERDFELPELKLLVDAVQSSKFITKKKSENIIKKIEGLTSKHEAKSLQRQVYVTNRIKAETETIYSVDNIHTAISQKKQITFKYLEWDETGKKKYRHNGKVYNISPWYLCWKDENYYLIGYDPESEGSARRRTYRVDKMENVQISDELREGEEVFKNFDLSSFINETTSMFSAKNERVTLRAKNFMANIIVDRFGQNLNMRKVKDEDCFDVTVKVDVSKLFLSWIMAFDGNIRIMGPENVIEEFKAIAERALESCK